MPWSVGTSRFDPCTRFCDVRFAAYQLGVAVGSAHRLYIANGTKTQISADLPEQQTKNRFSNLYLVSVPSADRVKGVNKRHPTGV